MTALEYMENQLIKHRLNFDREFARNVLPEQLENIRLKIGYYEKAVEALRNMADITYCMNTCCPFEDCERHSDNAPRNVPVSMACLDSTCRRYIGWLVDDAMARRDRIRYNLTNHEDKEAVDMVFDALERLIREEN